MERFISLNNKKIRIKYLILSFLKKLIQFFFPERCVGCGELLKEDTPLFCNNCFLTLKAINPPFCYKCGYPFPGYVKVSHLCGECIKEKRYFDFARSCFSYEGLIREAIQKFKFNGKVFIGLKFADIMFSRTSYFFEKRDWDLIIPVPVHINKLRKREFNQAQVLASKIAFYLGIPYLRYLLIKKINNPSQFSLKREDRIKNVKGVFDIVHPKKIKEKKLLLIDDVMTTGATVNECAKILKRYGAKRVDVFTIARTLK